MSSDDLNAYGQSGLVLVSISRDSVRVSCFGFSGRHGSHRPPLFAEQCTSILLRFPHTHLPRGGFGASVTRSVRRLDRPLGFEVSFSVFVHQSKGIVSARQGVQNPHIPCMCRSGTASSHVAVSASYGSLFAPMRRRDRCGRRRRDLDCTGSRGPCLFYP